MKNYYNYNPSPGGVAVLGVILIVNIILKIAGLVEWSWIFVLWPLWISLIFLFIILFIIFIFWIFTWR